jgi:glycosyltransferase involved in cell wall biosynthesis
MAAPIRVVMLDAMSMVPYYTGHLCASLSAAGGVEVKLASITYHHDPDFFRRQKIRNDPGLLDLACKLRDAPAAVRRLLKLLEYFINLAALLIRFTRSRPDIVHVQFLPLMSYGWRVEEWWQRMVQALGARVVYTVHNVLPQNSGDRHRATYRRIYQLADRLICHDSQAASRVAMEFGVKPEKITVIPHGLLFEESRSESSGPARARLGLAPDECIVLWQGILRPYKGISFLLQAWKQVCSKDPRARLAVVGSGDRNLEQALEDEVRLLGIQSRVRLELRFVSVQELADFYQGADVLVYPYREITTSGALLTGVVYGKPIVATALPAFEQILRHGDTALLVHYGDVDALASALLRLIGDEELRRTLGERLLASGFPRWAEIASRTCECYRAAVAARSICAGQPVRT